MTLFDHQSQRELQSRAPLAARMRPSTFDEFVGQQHIIGPDTVLRRSIESDQLPSIILWGPPGTAEIARHLQAIYGWDIETRRRVFETLEGSAPNAVDYRAGVVFDDGGLTVTAFEVVHTPPHNSYGLRIDFAGRSMVFSGDTKRCDRCNRSAIALHKTTIPTVS